MFLSVFSQAALSTFLCQSLAAVLMVQKNQANRNGSNNNRKESPNTVTTALDNRLETRNGFTGSNVKVNTSSHGKDDASGIIRGVSS